MMAVTRREEGGRPEVSLFGKYEDLYVKTPDGWRMKERIWRADSFGGSYQDVSPSPGPDDPRTYTTGQEPLIQRMQEAGQRRDAKGVPIRERLHEAGKRDQHLKGGEENQCDDLPALSKETPFANSAKDADDGEERHRRGQGNDHGWVVARSHIGHTEYKEPDQNHSDRPEYADDNGGVRTQIAGSA